MTRRHRAFLRWLGLGVLAVAVGRAAAQPWDPARALARPGWAWTEAQELDPSQARVSVQSFRASMAPLEAARELAAAAGQRLTRLQWTGRMLVLSGVRGEEHWLAQLQPEADGTVGLVSRLVPAPPPRTRFDPAALAPQGCRQALWVGSRVAADSASLGSFDCPGTPMRVAAAARGALRSAGWSEDESPAGSAAAEHPGATPDTPPLSAGWRHPRDGRLSVHLHARPRSVALTFWHHPQEPS